MSRSFCWESRKNLLRTSWIDSWGKFWKNSQTPVTFTCLQPSSQPHNSIIFVSYAWPIICKNILHCKVTSKLFDFSFMCLDSITFPLFFVYGMLIINISENPFWILYSYISPQSKPILSSVY